ncbi:MAG: pantetheine-phosphate adenylyltransferase [Treponema sp.]|nr:pantetheine-phosphate adenylyltransferase [Treponema sp.]
MVRAIFAGSFDPPTYGHLNVIERALSLFNEIHVVIAVNKNKQYLFSADERQTMLEELLKPWKNVSVYQWHSLIVDYAKENNATVLVRGVRNITDFTYEFDLSIMNKGLYPAVETIFIPTDPKYFLLKSSAIKELASFGGDVSSMVPPIVAENLKRKFF